MTTLEIILSLSAACLVIITTVSGWFAYKMARIVMAAEDAVNDSLDILEERYVSMSKILENPIFFDSVEIRQVMSDIRKCRDVVLDVANRLTLSIDEESVVDENTPGEEPN